MARRRLLRAALTALAWTGLGPAAAAATGTAGRLRPVALPDVRRVDAAADGGWWARDGVGGLWQISPDGRAAQVGSGLAATGMLASGHGRVAGLGLDGRLWVQDTNRPAAAPGRSTVPLVPHAGLCVLPLAIIAVVEQAGRPLLARLEPDARGLWQVVAHSSEPVLPDAVPIAVDLDGRQGGAHIAVLAGPDAQRYRHGVLGDAVEATRVLWLERHSLAPLRTLQLGAPAVFEDRLLRPWALPDGRTGLVVVQAGPLGAQLVVLAAATDAPAALVVAAAGPPIGTRHRWLSPASVVAAGGDLWAVHTPHIGGVLHRYRLQGAALLAEPVASGLSNHRLGERDLDVSARVGPWLLLPVQDGRRGAALHTASGALSDATAVGAPIQQWVAAADGRSALLRTDTSLAIWSP